MCKNRSSWGPGTGMQSRRQIGHVREQEQKHQGTEKNEGLCLCRRALIDRPKTKEDRCEFSICLDLIPGLCWCLPHRKSVCGRHTKHAKIEPHFPNIGTTCMLEEQKTNAVIVSRHTIGGSAQNIVTDLCKEGNNKHHVCSSQQPQVGIP